MDALTLELTANEDDLQQGSAAMNQWRTQWEEELTEKNSIDAELLTLRSEFEKSSATYDKEIEVTLTRTRTLTRTLTLKLTLILARTLTRTRTLTLTVTLTLTRWQVPPGAAHRELSHLLRGGDEGRVHSLHALRPQGAS